MDTGQLTFFPIINCIQRIALYETKANFYLVGSNNMQTRFRVLKIDRTEPRDLCMYDDKVEYNAKEIRNLINMIDSGNRNSFNNVTSAFGIVGFVRFLEGYYIILITRRTKVAVIGHHTLYKIEYTSMVYIPHSSVRIMHPDEPRYVKMFQAIDLSSNFYFSYSYDLTHTLQHNMSYPKHVIPTHLNENEFMRQHDNSPNNSMFSNISNTNRNFAVRSRPFRRFIWNSHMLKDVEKLLHPDWLLYITHGFITQSNINVFSKSVHVTLIARRSCKYAGTRFLKRGANFHGDVANEVETEQIVCDAGSSSFTAFVQMRGSVPGHWRQDMTKMMAKRPQITLDLKDPYAETAGAHVNDLLKRYGAPLVVLNLVKQREKKQQEKLLADEFSEAIKYLNQFLRPEFQVIYKTFDMARKNKSNKNVLGHLAGIARYAILKTGFFHNRIQFHSQNPNTVVNQKFTSSDGIEFNANSKIHLQTGIIRTNCVDCLDRTNSAQFAIGKCALGFQLCALGILDSVNLEFDTDCVRLLECLYEDHGDTLALQYGGSQLVHRVQTYRKTAPWTSQGNDIIQTLGRYFSNTFSDAEKQNTINLFLGLFVPDENHPPLWTYTTDYYFHFKTEDLLKSLNSVEKPKLLTQWWEENVVKCLPFAYNDMAKICSEIIQVQTTDLEMIDAYFDYYRPYELTVMKEVFAYKITNTIRDFMPNCTMNFSPFAIRVRPGRRMEDAKNVGRMKNPSMTGQSSTSSTTSSTSTDESECTDSTDEETSLTTNESAMIQSRDSAAITTDIKFASLFPSLDEVYGTEIITPSQKDLFLYKKYVIVGAKACGALKTPISSKLEIAQPISIFPPDSSLKVNAPRNDQKSIQIYENYVNTGMFGASKPSQENLSIYTKYFGFVNGIRA